MDCVSENVYSELSEYSDKKLAVGISGGRDSVCLLHAVVNCPIINRRNVLAVHVNHNLRETAKRDEEFVKKFCAELGVELACFSVDVKGEGGAGGIEQTARALRYRVFNGLISSHRADVILTAHHALDNAESVLMHIFRGAGIDGLKGIESGRIVRPFLKVYPEMLDGYAAANGLTYVTDETNFSDEADRNFLRLKVIPLIEQRYKGAVRAINALSEECSELCDYLDGQTDKSKLRYEKGVCYIPLFVLRGKLASRYVREALKHFTLTDITRAQIQNVIGLCRGSGSAVVELSGGIAAAREYGSVAIYIPRARCTAEKPLKTGANFIDGLPIDVTEDFIDPMFFKGGAVDLDKLDGATLRFRRDGDFITLFGGVRKKLRRFFIDSKIPKRLRDRIPLICRGDEVLVVCGVEISDGVKITEKTVRPGTVTVRW